MQNQFSESSINKLCRDVDLISRGVSVIKYTKRTEPDSDSIKKANSLAERDIYTRGRSSSPANKYPSYDSRGKSPPPVHRSNELPWSNDRRQLSHQYITDVMMPDHIVTIGSIGRILRSRHTVV